MNNKRKKGFTLVELVVVLVILGIIAAIAVPFFINYWKKAEFRKNEENAKTVYLAAESRLTYYRTSGQWEDFKKEIKKAAGSDGNSEIAQKAVFKDSNLNDRIYTIKLNKDAKNQTKKNNLVLRLLDDYIYDKGFFDASISIEIDMESGEVYSAFYGSRCKGLNYKEDDADGYLTMQKRDYDSRSKRLLGYYSTEDTVNVVNLEAKRLRITTINLVNSEKLSLDWSSNVGTDPGVDYEVSFYKNSDNTKLFTLRVSPYDMRQQGWSGTDDSVAGMATLELTKSDGTKDSSNWQFPVTYSDNKYSVVLDAMMSAKVQATLDSQKDDTVKAELEKSSSTSITRLATVAEALAEPQNIYAKVKAMPYTGTSKVNVNQEYRDSESVTSNVANTMFGDNTKEKDIQVSAFRHLSNMRYYEKNHEKDEAAFTLTNKNMDWASVGTGLYDFQTEKQPNGEKVEKLTWRENTKTETVGFPAIKELPKDYTLTGKGSQTLVSNLHLNEESVADDTTTTNLNISKSEFLGLFAELKGTVKNVTFRDPALMIGQKNENKSTGDCKSLKGIGVLAGRSEGKLTDVAITRTKQNSSTDKANIKVDVSNANVSENKDTLGVGMLVGVLADYENGEVKALSAGTMSKLSTEGKMEAILPGAAKQDDAYGIGGIVGYAKLKNERNAVKVDNCANHADISGNMSTGGVVGHLDGSFEYNKGKTYNAATLKQMANILDSTSDGLILCTSEEKNSSTVEGNYFGGIVGYSNQALIYRASSATGRAASFDYTNYVSKKDTLLRGNYVGGIAGYGNSTLLSNCSTEKNGYVLGYQYVGGIVGGLGDGVDEAIQASADGGASVTTNASYVIGYSYVGGIVGENAKSVTLKNCINNGVAAGYEKYVGGIVGYNQNSATIADCASYLSDYSGSIYNTIVNKWKANADYAGGIAGYNDGAITFSRKSEAITVKSVSSIVVGKNYVGGVVGFNDTNGSLDVHYTLIGGRIYSNGKCAGGAFGLNASESVLESELTIKPQSIQGNYYVGGCIGANVVNLSADRTMNKISTDNILGRITGNAFCGGIIGYERTYAQNQIGTAALQDVALKLLPELDGNSGVPTTVAASGNTYQLTITTTNNIPIRAGLYAGGIIGYSEKDSRLLLKDCKNSGDIAQNAASSWGWKSGVSLAAYVNSHEIGKTGLPSEADNVKMHFAGGIISVNLENQVIDNCSNTGNMSGYSGTGGVVGLNAGLVYNCKLNQHFGSATISYIGGIAGINVGTNQNTTKSYKDISYTAGTIQKCTTLQNKTVSGNSNVGGLVGWNLNDGVLTNNTSNANISASGNANAGGLAGRNNGKIIVKGAGGTAQTVTRRVSAGNAEAVGGLAGLNEQNGIITVTGNAGTNGEIVAVDDGVSINGSTKVGGVVGINHGTVGEKGSGTTLKYLTCKANSVRASHGYAGGIVGETNGDILCAVNRAATVTADEGTAGGITAVNNAGKTISNCTNYGNVTSSNGHASGIVAENAGTIDDCIVKSDKLTTTTEIYSRGVDEIGAITSLNTGVVRNSKTEKNVLLRGDASIFGGLVGSNEGTVGTSDSKFEMTVIPKIQSTKRNLTVGGAVGRNCQNATVTGAQVNVTENDADALNDFTSYQYLGGVVGQNIGLVSDSSFAGKITEKSGTAGNCYGGIAGINASGATLKDCEVTQITMTIVGVYSATSTSAASEKEAMSTHAGGIVGKNEENATVDGCSLKDNNKSKLTAKYGMLGGVTGFNKGTIQMSGSNLTNAIMSDDGNDTTAGYSMDTVADKLAAKAKAQGLKADNKYVNWKDSAQVEDLNYSGGGKVSAGRLQMIVSSNGNIGGITAYNGTTGELAECVSGNWFLANKSEAIGVGTGGIIGMNESQKNLSRLVNGAFVGRQLKDGATNRFAGGIIGNQNNTVSKDWSIDTCINYGTVYCYNCHYSGGIIGQWTGTGGNIKNCQNYGNLQTTYEQGWFGASAGIVAQLYHAYEDNEYNIISCDNFGNLYGRTGESKNNCANDSAGILGNVTNYEITDEKKSPKYTIQVLDCVNGPKVKIYSASMASGVVGFFSMDNVDVVEKKKGIKEASNQVKAATANVKLRIERCQNYAQVLSGRQFASGIFGDRYGKTGCENTILTNCYSVSTNQYSHGNNPIYSFAGSNGDGNPDYMKPENRVNNYFLRSAGTSVVSFNTGVELNHTNGTNREGKGTVKNDLSETGFKGTVRNQYAQYEYIMYDTVVKKWFVAAIEPGQTLNGESAYINDSNDQNYIKSKDHDVRVGQVLFYLDKEYTSLDQIINSDNIFYKYARESYRRIEGVYDDDGNKKLIAPKAVTAKVEDGKITLHITASDLPGSEKSEKCDPFKYKVHITDENGHSADKILYGESESFDIPSGLSGNLTITVQASSMYEDIQDSDLCTATVEQVAKILPEPDVRAELILVAGKSSSGNPDYRYQFSLNNLEDYKDYPGWQVEISLKGHDEKVVLNEKNTTNYLDLNLEGKRNSKDNTYQINAQATASGTADYESSPIVSTSAYLPYYQAFMGFREVSGTNKMSNVATPSAEITGNTLDALSVNIKIDNSNSSELLEVTPIYRAELIGNWKDSNETVVFAKTDIMTVSKGIATATFTNLPEYLKDAKNLKVRLWYAQTGLGPVYLYHDMTSENDGSVSSAMNLNRGRIKELTNVENGKETWSYTYSTTLNNEWGDFSPYIYTSDSLFTWLPAPALEQKDGTTLEPMIDSATGSLSYKFSWDKNVSGGQYQISLTGIDDAGRSVVIDTSNYSGGNSYTADADDWNYKQVKLKVTRVGDAAKGEVGLSTEATYHVKKRLGQPGQPGVELASENELNYNLTWPQISSEEGCSGYQAYIRAYEGDELGAETAVGKLITTDQNNNGAYGETISLEDYAGKRVVIYLKAKAETDSAYLDSIAGISYELNIPRRLEKPKVTWNINWNHDVNAFKEAEQFLNGGLNVSLTAQDDVSVPPGGSAYLLKAYVYDSEKAAKNAAESEGTDPGNYIAAYPTDGFVVQMDAQTTHQYYHNLQNLSIQYAGKWIVFYARISSGAGNISSEWTKSESYRLPYVKLQSPQVTSTETADVLTASVTETPDVPGVSQQWTAKRTVLNWTSVKCADIFALDLNGTITDSSADGGKKQLNTQLRIIEKDSGVSVQARREVPVEKQDALGNTYTDWEWQWQEIQENGTASQYPAGTPNNEIHYVYDINDYSVTIESTYEAANKGKPTYQLTLQTQLDVVQNEDGTYSYALKLPDVSDVKAADGSSVTHANFNISDSAIFKANVTENVDGDKVEQKSEAYIESDETKIEWKK